MLRVLGGLAFPGFMAAGGGAARQSDLDKVH